MARMIPSSGPREYDPRSREGAIYSALEALSDDYTVVHSLSLVSVADGSIKENEADFVVFNKDKGIICFEAKAGQVSYRDGEWFYSSGIPMKHGGPFNQAQNIKYRLMDEMRAKGLKRELAGCKMYHAVWFPSVSSKDIAGVNLPEEATRHLLLTKDDLMNPEPAMDHIFSLDVAHRAQCLTKRQADAIVERVLCPEFQVVPAARTKYDFDDIRFARLLKSQSNVLNFLQEQKSAVINGVAGSGKTLIAVEQAKRAASAGEEVLFLCYNRLLGEDVRRRCMDVDLVDVYTVDAFSCKICGAIDYALLCEKLINEPKLFPYRHVVVDEGQDFGSNTTGVSKSELLDTLKLLVEEKGGTFYLFYDKYQLVQGSGLPDFINDADCKLTLWVNCRNTFNIAKCSTRSLGSDLACKVRDLAPAGSVPKMSYSCEVDEQISYVDKYVRELHGLGLFDVVILTCKTEDSSCLSSAFSGALGQRTWRNTKVPVYSCRRFKGLEADAVILVDVTADLWADCEDDSAFKPRSGLIFYTGASRARHELRIVCDMDQGDFAEAVEEMSIASRRNPVKSFAKQINVLPDARLFSSSLQQ